MLTSSFDIVYSICLENEFRENVKTLKICISFFKFSYFTKKNFDLNLKIKIYLHYVTVKYLKVYDELHKKNNIKKNEPSLLIKFYKNWILVKKSLRKNNIKKL